MMVKLMLMLRYPPLALWTVDGGGRWIVDCGLRTRRRGARVEGVRVNGGGLAAPVGRAGPGFTPAGSGPALASTLTAPPGGRGRSLVGRGEWKIGDAGRIAGYVRAHGTFAKQHGRTRQ